jgi:hypothetical protein
MQLFFLSLVLKYNINENRDEFFFLTNHCGGEPQMHFKGFKDVHVAEILTIGAPVQVLQEELAQNWPSKC